MVSIERPPPHVEDTIRVVDISAWRSASSTPEQRDAVVAALHHACTTCGFFQLVGHGVPLALQTQVLRCAETFFALPMAEKMAVSSKKSTSRANRGYETLQWQTLQPGTLPDLKEIGEEIPADDPRAGRFLQGPNLWPSSLPKSGFETPLMEYRGYLVEIAELLLDLLRRALPGIVPADLFDDFRVRPAAMLRIWRYPPQTSTDDRQFGAGAHTDFGGITLLLQQPGSTGLEVLHPLSSRWISVPAVEDALVVNIGDLLNLWTGGYFLSAVHRVINREPRHRYSAPFFYNGNVDSSFIPLDITGTNTRDRQVLTVEEHLCQKLAASVERVKAAAIDPDPVTAVTESPIEV